MPKTGSSRRRRKRGNLWPASTLSIPFGDFDTFWWGFVPKRKTKQTNKHKKSKPSFCVLLLFVFSFFFLFFWQKKKRRGFVVEKLTCDLCFFVFFVSFFFFLFFLCSPHMFLFLPLLSLPNSFPFFFVQKKRETNKKTKNKQKKRQKFCNHTTDRELVGEITQHCGAFRI